MEVHNGGMMITLETSSYLSLASSITSSKHDYVSRDKKLLLLDMLYFVSIVAKTPKGCTTNDFNAFNKLYDYCIECGISPEVYVCCAYSYMTKYFSSNHPIPLSSFLSDSVISYCSKNLAACNSDGLLHNIVKTELTYTEKLVRAYKLDNNVSYVTAAAKLLSQGKLSNLFLLYKKYMGTAPFDTFELSEKLAHFYSVLKPVFDNLAIKHGLYPKNKIDRWNNSKIEVFHDCQIYFRDLYLHQDIPPKYLKNSATDVGSAVHKVYEDILQKYSKSKKKDLHAIFTRHMASKSVEEIKDTIIEHLPGIEFFFTDPTSPLLMNLTKDTKLHTEILMEYTDPESGITFYGTADLVLINGDQAILIDYKTSKIAEQKWIDKNNEKYCKQLSLYAKFIKATFNVSNVTAHIIYTRGLVHTYTSLNDDIIEDRVVDITRINNAIKMNSFRPNSSHCFLCRHPNCNYRSRESIWDEEGKRKPRN